MEHDAAGPSIHSYSHWKVEGMVQESYRLRMADLVKSWQILYIFEARGKSVSQVSQVAVAIYYELYTFTL